ncbi:hypothetical protein THAOC_31418 [Thalassiosira oceanica]|uniref:Uncharacterized protein n=1 Tax=Thalassiosira oceanica TaxID=159749 RepID=K0R883_THAOC|nr:hypothetical protein THAOC_31418 [Thalassiosira oceanica]|eukprot:EJK49678.1 hypothetical protein THAOC_31418 [Thalassiosira oceanica]
MARSDHVTAELLNGSVLTITEAKHFKDQLESVLEGIPNVYGNGYVGLLKTIGDPLLAQKTSSVCTAQKLVDSAADKDSAYTTVDEAAREEANERNVHTQRTLGVKGGVIAKSLKKLGRDIVGEITHNEDGTRKSKATNTIKFVHKRDVPANRLRDVTYGQFVCTVRPEKKEKNRS